MALGPDSLSKAEAGEPSFSSLKASLVSALVAPRPKSLDAKVCNDMPKQMILMLTNWILDTILIIASILSTASALCSKSLNLYQCHQHLANLRNFFDEYAY